MKRIEYTLTAEDLLQLNLYHASISPKHIARRRRTRFVFLAVYLALAGTFLYAGAYIGAAACALIAVLWNLVFPRWIAWKTRRQLEKKIAETIGDSLPKPATLELLPDAIFSSSHTGETRFPYDEVDRIEEEDGYTYIFLEKGMALVMPHDRIPVDTIAAFVAAVKNRMDGGAASGGE